MPSPYLTPPRERSATGLSPTMRITRSRAKLQCSDSPSSAPARRQLADQSSPEAGSSMPAKVRTVRRTKTAVQYPPIPESLPRSSKRARPSVKQVKGHVDTENPDVILAKDETGVNEPVTKVHLAQERLMHDPWKLLVMTTLLNKTSGRAVRPIFEVLMQRYPSALSLSQASIPDLADLLYPLGLFNQRASSLIRFSQQYLSLGWPTESEEGTPACSNGHVPLNKPMPASLDVTVFHGSGVYASDSFRIYSPLLSGGGGTRTEAKWIGKRQRAFGRMKKLGISQQEADRSEAVRRYMSDEEDAGEEEWRDVRPADKELRRYLIWRWGIEEVLYDIHSGPQIKCGRDRQRLARHLKPPDDLSEAE